MKEDITLYGTVEDIVHQNKDNHYAVISFLTSEGELVPAVGTMPFVTMGEEAYLHGVYVSHSEYGRQFSVTFYEKVMPREAEAILRYLASGVIKGVGKKTARHIVDRFGTETFTVIEQHPEYLTDIPGITNKKASAIHRAFMEQDAVRQMVVLCGAHLSPASLSRACKTLGARGSECIKENPFVLCERVEGISFTEVDALAASLGADKTSQARLYSGLSYILLYNTGFSGHCCLPKKELLALAAKELDVGEDLLEEALLEAIEEGRIDEYEKGGETMLFHRRYADAEAYVATRLSRLDRNVPAFSHEDVERLVERAEMQSGLIYAPLQRHAISESLTGGVLIVTGGPGTGKTTLIRALVSIYEALGYRTALVAPTGRAAKRMSEATGREAATVHRMLEMSREGDGSDPVFHRNEQNPIEEDVVIVDEASMLDLLLTEALLRASRRGMRFVFIGDVDQLPSVGAGNVLRDMIGSGCFRTVRLVDIFRQSENSMIVTGAHKINCGELPTLDAKNGDFFFLRRESFAVADTVASLLSVRLPRAYGEQIREEIQVITPSRRGIAGTEELNRTLQAALNPPRKGKNEHTFRSTCFRTGDKVMQIRNNYDIAWKKDEREGYGIYNGDIGKILQIDTRERSMTVDFDGRLTPYDFELLEDLEPAYAVTVHKSQGSEYPVVIIALPDVPPLLRTRNLLYTAVTRAKKMAILVGRREIVEEMVRMDKRALRYTCLAERLLAYEKQNQ